jgi:Right handed beta helix region
MEDPLKRTFVLSALLAALIFVLTASAAPTTTTCTPTGFVRDSINLTAALINPGNVTGVVDATGCNIGIYYGTGSHGTVSRAEVFGANYFGVVNDGGNVNIQNSKVHNIGEVPFNGTQHGVAIYFAYDSGAKGSITGNTVSQYQKGGIVVNGGNVSANITGNTVTGLGRVNYIAGNGIQLGFGAHGVILGNTVSGNAYTGANNASSAGILVFGGCGDPQVTGVQIDLNTVVNNDMGIYLVNNDDSCTTPATSPTHDDVLLNRVTNDTVSNISGNGDGRGYQAGIVDTGNGDSISGNRISGVGYQATNSATVLIFPIDTSLTTNVRLHFNRIG